MKIEKINLPFNNRYKIYFIYNNKENIYLYVRNKRSIFKEGDIIDLHEDDYIYNIKYNNNGIELINVYGLLNELEAINYITNKYIIKENNIKINCTKNLGLCPFCGNFHCNNLFRLFFENRMNRIMISGINFIKQFSFPKTVPILKFEIVKKQRYFEFKKKKQKKGRNYFYSKKVHPSNGFKKKYR